ncbi:MAG: hypothetical protein ABIJ92_02155 [Candidatus Aenigmatarchaeota archaeon]
MSRQNELYEEPEIQMVSGNRINKDRLAEARFNDGVIKIPDFSGAYQTAKNSGDTFLASVAKGIQSYLLGHELQVEWYGRPETDKAEIPLEAAYMKELKYNADRGIEGDSLMSYLTGLALHDMRYGNGGGFSKAVDGYFKIKDNVRDAAKKYGTLWNDIKNYAKSILEDDIPDHAYAFAEVD